jgi:chitinase
MLNGTIHLTDRWKKIKLFQLFQMLRNAFEKESRLTGRPRLLLTAAVAAGEKTIQTAYDIDLISK